VLQGVRQAIINIEGKKSRENFTIALDWDE
jgi:hypothetical protein